MIWFNIKKLENKIREGNVSDKEAMHYLIGNTLMYTAGTYISGYEDMNNSILLLMVILVLAITVLGIFKTYATNTEGGGEDFFKRFQCLMFVTGIRLLIIMIAVLIVLTMIFHSNKNILESDWYELGLAVGTSALFYYNLNQSFERVNATSQSSTV